MVWLDELVHWQPGFAQCSAEIVEETALVDEQGLNTSLLLEYMAQAVAACQGYQALKEGRGVRVGMIVGCRSFEMAQEYIPMGSQLLVEAHRERDVDSVSKFRCAVKLGDTEVASSQMILYHASQPPT